MAFTKGYKQTKPRSGAVKYIDDCDDDDDDVVLGAAEYHHFSRASKILQNIMHAEFMSFLSLTDGLVLSDLIGIFILSLSFFETDRQNKKFHNILLKTVMNL